MKGHNVVLWMSEEILVEKSLFVMAKFPTAKTMKILTLILPLTTM